MVGRVSSWHPQDDELLKRLAKEGHNAREIAERMKRTPDAIRRRSLLHSIPISKATNGTRWSVNEDVRLRQLAQAGFSIPEIAADMRKSKSAVRRHAGELQLKIARGVNGITRALLEERLSRSSSSLASPSERLTELRHSVSASQVSRKTKAK